MRSAPELTTPSEEELNATLRYGCAQSKLGTVLAAASRKGLCFVALGDDCTTLTNALRQQFPRAQLVHDDDPNRASSFAPLLKHVVQYLDAPGLELALPLDIKGTPFQQEVWNALRHIPPGTTITYAELARRVGRPSAVRAVASACGANKLAIVIPCHRVVGSDGSLTGYRWGIRIKHALLRQEAAQVTGGNPELAVREQDVA